MTSAKGIVLGLTAMSAAAAVPGIARAQAQDRPPPNAVAADSLPAGATVSHTVEGMSCPFCAYALEKRLSDLPGVDSVVVRVADGLVRIRVQPGRRLTEEELRREVARAGFSLREVRRIGP